MSKYWAAWDCDCFFGSSFVKPWLLVTQLISAEIWTTLWHDGLGIFSKRMQWRADCSMMHKSKYNISGYCRLWLFPCWPFSQTLVSQLIGFGRYPNYWMAWEIVRFFKAHAGSTDCVTRICHPWISTSHREKRDSLWYHALRPNSSLEYKTKKFYHLKEKLYFHNSSKLSHYYCSK